MRKTGCLVLVALLQAPLGIVCAAAAPTAPFVITRDGHPEATIIVAKEPTSAAAFAAKELQEHIRLISGATLPITTDESPVKGHRILVGESAATHALKLGPPLKPQEHLITFDRDTLVLMGRDAQSLTADEKGFPERTEGRFGSALAFNGESTVLSVSDCLFNDAAGTLEAWVWTPAAAPEKPGTILRLDGKEPWTYHILQRDAKSGGVSYTTYDGKSGHGVQSGPLTEGWHHLLATYDAAAARMDLFVDGTHINSATYVQTSCKGAALKIGGVRDTIQGNTSNPFKGAIDEVRISSVIRTPSAGSPHTPYVADPDTVALFHFDETAGKLHNSATAHHMAIPPDNLFEDRGSLDAVYDFLERFCDVRWYAPTEIGLVYPAAPTLVVRGPTIRRAPAMAYRWMEPSPIYLPTPSDKVAPREVLLWKLRMRLGGQPFAVNHSFYGYYDRFLVAHPDWFAQGYTGKPPQMCYTNPDFIQQVVQDARDYFDGKGKHPGAVAMGDMFGLGPMDNSQYCKCPRCQSQMDEAERDNPQFTGGFVSTYIFGFVNKVAAEVRKTHPDKWIGTLAYAKYAYCPSAIHLEPNIMVQPCLHTRNWWCPSLAANDRKVLADWRHQDPERPIYLWLYYCFPALNAKYSKFHYFPGFFAHSVIEQMRLFHDANVRGFFIEHSCELGATFLMDQLELYLTFKLADDPTLDGEQLIEEFFTRYYGAAAAPMKALYLAIEDTFSNPASYPETIQKTPAHQHQTAQLAWDSLGTPERMAQYAGWMAQARTAAKNPTEKTRVALFEKGIWDYMVEGRKQQDESPRSPALP